MATRFPPEVKVRIEEIERWGHKLVSQGCGLFWCVHCDKKFWLDQEPNEREVCTEKESK